MKKVWTKKSLGKHKFFGKWIKQGKSRYFLLESPTYGGTFEGNSWQMFKASGWVTK